MMNKFLLLIGVVSILLTGCSEPRQLVISSDTESSGTVLSLERTGRFVKDDGPPVFDLEDTLPVLKDGKLVAKLRINQIEKLGIWDWNNTEAVTNSIKYSYSINYTMIPVEDLTGRTLKVNPYLQCESLVVGKPCIVGWNGFEDDVTFYKNEEVWAEIGLQPITNDEPIILRLEITDDSDGYYESIELDAKILESAKEGPSLLTEKDSVKIKSINKAKFKLWISDVHKETHKIPNGGDDSIFYDFCYKVKYLKTPETNQDVSLFNKDNEMVSRLVVGVQSNLEETILREETQVKGVERVLWSDWSTTGLYLTRKYPSLEVGETTEIWQNRKAGNLSSATVLRFMFEFPEEVAVRTKEQLLNFNGRYVVFQEKITKRELEERND